MSSPTNTVQSYNTVGNREDLSDIITRISPTTTPFMSGIGKSKASNTLHEWQTQDLTAAGNNAQIEGDDVSTFTAAIPTVRLNNRCQISTKSVVVSDTQTSGMNPAGRKNELAFQISLRSLELKRDIEVALTQNSTAVVGSASVGRQTRGLEGWIATNVDLGVGGAAPNYVTNVAATDGTARAFTESQLKNVLQLIFTQGGEPNTVMVGPLQKQTFSTFTGNTTKFDKSEDKSLTAAVDVYVSDFGTVNVVPNRFQRPRTAFVLQMDKFKMAMLRPFETKVLGKTGDAEKRLITVEYALECLQEKASGAVRDVL